MGTLAAGQSGCTQPQRQPAAAAATRETAEQVRARAESSFRQAVFYKPREDAMIGQEMTFAPLIVQEVDGGEGTLDPNPFGAIVGGEDGLKVDPTRPTVYAGTLTARIHEADHDQIVYSWCYPSHPAEPAIVFLEERGVRITLGSDGFPLVWEVVSTDTDTRVLFVSESLEAAAKREFGDPLLGRRYAVERSLQETPDVIVARILDDGPVPMGPYVYLNSPPHRIVTTVLCRCMPSQVNEFVETQSYDLMPPETIKIGHEAQPPSAELHNGGPRFHWNPWIRRENQPLEQILRWPKGM